MPPQNAGSRGHRALLAALLGTVLLFTAAWTGVGALLTTASTEGVRAGLTARVGADRGLGFTLPLAADPPTQDATVRAALAESFAGITAPIAIDSATQGVVSARVTDPGAPTSTRSVVAASIPDLPDRVELVDGAWPSSEDEATIQADAADGLGIGPGSTLAVGDVVLRITGVWRVGDPLEPRWLGDDLPLRGRDDDGYGPLVIDPGLWPRLDSEPLARWILVPDAATITPEDLRSIPSIWAGLARSWRGEVPDAGSMRREGAFDDTAGELTTLVDGLFAVRPVALLLLAAVGIIALGELGRLLAAGRAAEISLRWARGGRPIALAVGSALPAVVLALAGGLAGGALTVVLGADLADAAVTATLGASAAGLTVGLATFRVAAARDDPRRRRIDPRASRAVGGSAAVLAIGAAALATWQLRLYGSPVVPAADGGGQVDPLAVSAPVLVLVAGVALALVLFPLAARALDRRTAGAGATTALALAGLARRPLRAAAAISVVALAAGSIAIAAGYSGSWSSSFRDASRLRTGAALQVSIPGPGVDAATIDDIAATPGVRAVAPVAIQPLTLGESAGSLVAATPGAVADLTRTTSGFDADAVGEAIAASAPGVTLTDGASTATLRIEMSGLTAPPEVALQVMTRLGRLLDVPLEADAVGPSTRGDVVDYAGDLPALAGDAALAVLAIDFRFAPGTTSDGGRIALVAAGSDATSEEVAGYWAPEAPRFTAGYPFTAGPTAFTLGAGLGFARLTATFDGSKEDRISTPVVISQALADRYGIEVDDPVEFSLQQTASVVGFVDAIVPGVPGSPDAAALLLDAVVVRHAELRSFSEDAIAGLWVDAANPTTAAAAIRPLLPPDARIDDSADPAAREVLGAAVVAVALAAAAAVVLALTALVAAGAADRASRRPESAVLRALGFRPREQGRVRLVENAVALGFGMIAGAGVGAVVVVLAIGPFAIAAVPNAPSGGGASLALDPLLLAATAVPFLVALALVVLGAAHGARRDARGALVRGDMS